MCAEGKGFALSQSRERALQFTSSMRGESQLPTRRSVRLKGFDYAQPSRYFLTICTHNKRHLFGKVTGKEVTLNSRGKFINECWLSIPTHFPNAELSRHVVMPNHVHGIVVVRDRVSAGQGDGRTALTIRDSSVRRIGALGAGSIPTIVRSFKAITARRLRESFGESQTPIWQRGYYERVIRDEDEFQDTCKYIRLNPAKWAFDEENL
jgi:putative transposase